jgi:diaminohydroxyphosphoribosylaminopyrimidine deaminase / 5-amino-6-(5-phosphoribosylamino)uracil reductase
MPSYDEHFMRQALALARSGPSPSPNPRVGAVLVRDGRVIGRGAHRGPGTPHAETLALAKGDATGASLYVTLEPCNFFGRTPPCAPAVIQAGVHRVVVAMEDPDERVRGKGLAEMRAAGLQVATGVLEQPARRINRAFIRQRTTGLPSLVLKLALTLDGRLAAANGSSRWITSARTRAVVHEQRSRSDAVMVGAGTVEMDDPSLSVRDVALQRQPIRIVLDSSGRLRSSTAVFSSVQESPLIVATTEGASQSARDSWTQAGAEVLVLGRSPEGIDLAQLLRALGERGLLQVYCEGGAELATSLLRHRLVDRLELHYGPQMVGDGPSIGDLGVEDMGAARQWRTLDVTRVDDDILVTLEPMG